MLFFHLFFFIFCSQPVKMNIHQNLSVLLIQKQHKNLVFSTVCTLAMYCAVLSTTVTSKLRGRLKKQTRLLAAN